MNERDTRSLFSRFTARKPVTWEEIPALPNLESLRTAIKYLPRMNIVTECPPYKLSISPDRYEWVAKRESCYYYINTEGFEYARYAARIPIEMLEEDGLDIFAAYPSEYRELLEAANEKGYIKWSSDAAVKNGGKGFYVPTNSLIDFISAFVESE